MVDKKISALAAAAAITGTEAIPVVQSGATVKSTPDALDTYLQTTHKQFQISATFSNSVTFLQTLSVSGNANFRGAVTVSGALNALTSLSVSGQANFKTDLNVSATVSAAVVTSGGFQNAWHKLGSASGANANHFGVSGVWTNYPQLSLYVTGKGQTTSTNWIINLYTDGGTTPIMTYNLVAAASATASDAILYADIYGSNADSGVKMVIPIQHFQGVATQNAQTRSTTANAGLLNAIYVSIGAGATTATISAGHMTLYGIIK